MIVTKWTMRRFHIASLLVLICARMVQGFPAPLPPSPQPGTASSSSQSKPPTSDETASTSATPTPVKEEGNFFQGDIRLTPEDDPYDLFDNMRVFKRMAFDGSGAEETNSSGLSARLWPNGTVPYVYYRHLTMDYRNIFEDAIAEWESATCIDFVRISDENIIENDYLILTDRSGCSSYVGRIGGPQEVSINDGCAAVGHALHELGHAVGLWHEHSRWDRNFYIRIIRENIKENAYYNFGTLSEEKWSHIPDVGYDLLSIMHYGPKAFNSNGQDTIEVTVAVDECAIQKMGQRVKLSKKDKLRTSKMYNCENETQRAENSQEKCQVELTEPTPTTQPVTTKLLTDDLLRLNTNTSRHQSLLCNEHRCHKEECTFNPIFQILICDEGFDFSIHRYTQRKNKKIKNNDIVNIKSLHRTSRWLECNGQNICALSECSANNGNISSNISECQDQKFKIVSTRTTLKNGSKFTLKHEFNDTFLYCNDKWCDLLPVCPEGHIEESENRADVTCRSPTEFYVQKLET